MQTKRSLKKGIIELSQKLKEEYAPLHLRYLEISNLSGLAIKRPVILRKNQISGYL
jgi:hypothetical protein